MLCLQHHRQCQACMLFMQPKSAQEKNDWMDFTSEFYYMYTSHSV